MQPRVEGAMGAVRIAHCMVRSFFLPCRCANPWDIKPTPQGSRAVTERELWAAPVAAMWPHMGSQQLLCLWLQKMSLFPFVLKLDAVPTKASVAQNTAPPPQPAQPLAPSCHPAQLWELQELKTLAIKRNTCQQQDRNSLWAALLSPLEVQPGAKECSTSAQGEAEGCPQLLSALTTALQCFSPPATRVTLRLSGQTLQAQPQGPPDSSAVLSSQDQGGFLQQQGKAEHINSVPPTRQGGLHLNNSPTRRFPSWFSTPWNRNNELHTNKGLQIKPLEGRVTGSFTTHLRSPRIPKVCQSL